MSKNKLPCIKYTLHQIAVGTAATVIGTIIALLIWQMIEARQQTNPVTVTKPVPTPITDIVVPVHRTQ